MFAKLQQRVAGVENNSSSSVWGRDCLGALIHVFAVSESRIQFK